MTTQRISSPARLTSLFIGFGLLFIGGRFLLTPEIAEAGFGLHFQEPDYAFHYSKASGTFFQD